MRYWIIHWILSGVALLIVANILPGIQVESFGSALIAALVIGLVSATVGLDSEDHSSAVYSADAGVGLLPDQRADVEAGFGTGAGISGQRMPAGSARVHPSDARGLPAEPPRGRVTMNR